MVNFSRSNQSTASANESITLVGCCAAVDSIFSIYLPVFTRIPFIPTFIAPQTSSFKSCHWKCIVENSESRQTKGHSTYIADHATFSWCNIFWHDTLEEISIWLSNDDRLPPSRVLQAFCETAGTDGQTIATFIILSFVHGNQ